MKLKSSTVQEKKQAAVGSYVFPRSWLGNGIAEHISQHDYLGKSAERSFEAGWGRQHILIKPPAFKRSPNNSRRKLPGLQRERLPFAHGDQLILKAGP